MNNNNELEREIRRQIISIVKIKGYFENGLFA